MIDEMSDVRRDGSTLFNFVSVSQFQEETEVPILKKLKISVVF
jgi:hypothetical protein